MGIHSKVSDNEKLDSRLSSHRNTYAKFELITVVSFINSSTVRLFEELTKVSLGSYSIGQNTDTRLEQYSFVGTDVNITNLIIKLLDVMNIELQNLGSICPNEKIIEYNNKVFHNLR